MGLDPLGVFRSQFSDKSVVGSTERGEEEYITGLTCQIARSTIEDDFGVNDMTFGNQRYVGLELGSGCGVGKRHVVAIQVDSTRSPKFLVTWALLYAAAGEAARMRMNEEDSSRFDANWLDHHRRRSLHSWLGITIIVLYGIQWIYGFLVFFFPGGSTAVMSESLPWHVLLGAFAYILAVANAAIGLLEKLTFLENSGLAKYSPEALLVNFTAVVAILYAAFVILTVIGQGPPVKDDSSRTAVQE
ncbi:hypothetical protein GH714_027268 [Hevea brasiliensis]|uniref:Cytochrome b561 domain-containing protein n=1 Tax=Hevea brasiliensis TaxID=3981 RepID=A0A6A6N831_HEVBR|nr:hypothetical protein GH714_027268 [Hevea brasiliensis]